MTRPCRRLAAPKLSAPERAAALESTCASTKVGHVEVLHPLGSPVLGGRTGAHTKSMRWCGTLRSNQVLDTAGALVS